MWYHSTTERVIGIFETSCGYCEQDANFKLSREEDFFLFLFVIPFWSSGNYYTTCGNCHNTFKLKTKEGEALEKEIIGSIGAERMMSNAKKKLIVMNLGSV